MDDVDWRTIRVADCELSVRTRNGLVIDHGPAVTLGGLDAKTDAEIVRSPNIGRRGLKEIREAIETLKAAYPAPPPAPPVFLPSTEIDWALLGRAVEFYKAKGYTYIEAPWAVSEQSIAITCPNPKFTARVDHLGSLVGSAEQSFLHLDMAGELPEGRFVACTPCFRLGDHEDDLHFPYFMKVELYQRGNDPMAMFNMIGDAGGCFMANGVEKEQLKTAETDEGYDVLINGIEVGSYGIRGHRRPGHDIFYWTYGTGIALPRFSQALARS